MADVNPAAGIQNVSAVPECVDVEQVCEQFETRFRTGHTPEILDFVDGWEEPERSRLISELVCVEIRLRRNSGLAVNMQDFLDRLPGCETPVREAFAESEDQQTIMLGEGTETLPTQSTLRHLRFLAEGGLGQVFIAEDATLRRDAAVKLIREEIAQDSDSRDQFRLEAEVTGRLDHPGIPVVYSIGETATGRLFYAMQYVRGTRLDKLIRLHHKIYSHSHGTQWFGLRRLSTKSIRKESIGDGDDKAQGDPMPMEKASSVNAPDLRELLEIFISVCHTVGYAHRRGILHRDIKPSNVIHGKFGETVVIDWGLALPVARQGVFKDVAEQTIAPRSGKNSRQTTGCIGTPAFMSPEQAAGDVPLTPASDLFSLGALLYCILTGTPPYKGQGVRDVRQKAMDCDFPPPSSLVENLPAPLDAICRKAMKAQITDRYRTTHELVADLRAYLADRPVSAHADTPYRKLVRWMRHNIHVVLAVKFALLLLASAIAVHAVWSSSALNVEQQTRLVQEKWANEERSLREKSLMMAATLAAKTLSNKIDVIYRTLEGHAMETALQEPLTLWNQSPDADTQQELQKWLDQTFARQPNALKFRSWFLIGADGTYLARSPEFDEGGRRSSSINKNFAFRDYFHGLGQDLPPASPAASPMSQPHNSAAIFSTMDHELTVNFAVPIRRAEGEAPMGILDVCVECSEFADLEIDRRGYIQLLLVEGRGYPMSNLEWSDMADGFITTSKTLWSSGIVLHHESDKYRATFDNPPRVADSVLEKLLAPSDVSSLGTDAMFAKKPQLFGAGEYEDPIQPEVGKRWMAAYSPVIIESRKDPEVANTGWYVIVQQELAEGQD